MTDVASRPASNMPNFPRTPSNSGAARQTPKKSQVGKSQLNNTKASTDGGDPFTQNDLESVADGQSQENGTNDGQEEGSEDEGTEVIPAGSVDHEGSVLDKNGLKIGQVKGEATSELQGSMVDQEGDIIDAEGNVIGTADLKKDASSSVNGDKPVLEDQAPFGVQDNGDITNATGSVVGKLAEGKPQDLVGTAITAIDASGNLKAESGSTLGKAELHDKVPSEADTEKPQQPVDDAQLSAKSDSAAEKQDVQATNLKQVDDLKPEDSASKLGAEKTPDAPDAATGSEAVKDEDSKVSASDTAVPDATKGSEALDEVEPKPVEDNEASAETAEPQDLSILKDKKVNKLGKIVDDSGTPFGQLIEGDPKKLAGKKVDGEGQIWDDRGQVIGRAELLPESEREAEASGPFEDFPDSIVDKSGNVIFEGKIVGKLIEGDAKKLEGKKVDADGDVLDKNGNTLGKAERFQEEDAVPEEEAPAADLSALEGKKVNKAGNVVDDNGKLFGRVATGDVAKLVGKKVDSEGKIWSESGKVIGTAELLDVDDRDQGSDSPFEDFPDALVEKTGNVIFEGQVVGRLIEGDAKKLAGKKVDKDGDVLDKVGNVLGKAERWTEEEAPEPEKIDMSALAGKRVNKLGNLVDSHGSIYGRLVEGDAKKLNGKMSDKNGDIWDDGGKVVGKAELVPESERDGQKEGIFTGFDSPTVTKDGKVADSKGTIIGRLIEGDAKKLYGKAVDTDGDVTDSNGNSLGKAERWEEEEKEKAHSPVEGRKVNKEGNVVDENGDLIAKLTEGEITKCSGKEIDADGDVYNSKNQVIGHVTLLAEIPAEPEPEPEPQAEVEEEPKESQEEIDAKKQIEQDTKLASRMAFSIQESIDKISPILKNITEEIDAVERQKEADRDEQKLVDKVKPLIEEGGRILTETNGIIRGMDPDGRITANAKQKSATREATPEEHHLAELLKELTGNVTQTIEKAKKKIAGMPHAKKELNPLWGLLAEPLGQILAAVGLLLSGVLGLVGRLLSGLGLGGLLDNLLGGLGIKGILKGLGLGMVTESLTGRK
ncbi:hypothetical protein VTL71DRAFT_1254 [Oculimacula yallundae]|uniref:DUF6987 domain-containing protein n=1 Tax=Oculimacula yallundae TaxID=86028 RepID=A0ABR4CA75_9HELO